MAPSNRYFCGPYELDLMDVLCAAVWMLHKNGHWIEPMPSFQFNIFVDWWYKLRPREKPSTATFDSVLEVLFFSRNRRTTDARDRVFALLGLLPEDVSKTIVPDYRTSALDLMQRVTREYLLDGTKADDVSSAIFTICSLEEGCGVGGWPSWVPRWDVNQCASPANCPYSSLLVARNG